MLLAKLQSEIIFAEVFHKRQWWGFTRRYRVGRRDHQIGKLGLALVEEGLEIGPLVFIVDIVDNRCVPWYGRLIFPSFLEPCLMLVNLIKGENGERQEMALTSKLLQDLGCLLLLVGRL